MDPANIIAGVVIAAIGALASIAAGRAAARASTTNSKTDAEKEAYERARAMDVATIERQDKEIEELRAQNSLLRKENEELRIVKEQNGYLNADVKRVDKDNTRLEGENREMKHELALLREQIQELLRGNAIYVSSERIVPPRSQEVPTDPMMREVQGDEVEGGYPDLD